MNQPSRALLHRTMARTATAIVLAASAACAAPAFAGPATDALASCLTDRTTGKDRKDLARWIFISMAAHPEIKDLSKVTPAASEESSRLIAALLTKLLTESCVVQVRAMVKSEGPDSMRAAFEYLGKAAFAELTTNPDVSKSIQGFQQYVDRGKLERAMR